MMRAQGTQNWQSNAVKAENMSGLLQLTSKVQDTGTFWNLVHQIINLIDNFKVI